MDDLAADNLRAVALGANLRDRKYTSLTMKTISLKAPEPGAEKDLSLILVAPYSDEILNRRQKSDRTGQLS